MPVAAGQTELHIWSHSSSRRISSPFPLSCVLRRSLALRSVPELCFASSSPGSSQPASKPASKSASKMAGDHGNIHVINNASAWDAKIEEAKNDNKIIVVDFTATWCGPCRSMTPIFVDLSKKFENLTFLKVDVDEVQDVTAKWDIRAMPTFVFIKDGKLLDKIVGANKDELERKCSQHSLSTVTS